MSDPLSAVTLAEIQAAYRLLRAIDERLKEHGLTTLLLITLAAVADHPGETFGAVRRTLDIGATTATVRVDQLAARGLVKRLPHAKNAPDRRQLLVELTDRGRALSAAFAPSEATRAEPGDRGERQTKGRKHA